MAIINCPECGNSISDTADTCPYCGVNVLFARGFGDLLLDFSDFQPYACDADMFDSLDWQEKEDYRIHSIQAKSNNQVCNVSVDNVPTPPTYRYVRVSTNGTNGNEAKVNFYIGYEYLGAAIAHRGQKQTIKITHKHVHVDSYTEIEDDRYRRYPDENYWKNEVKPVVDANSILDAFTTLLNGLTDAIKKATPTQALPRQTTSYSSDDDYDEPFDPDYDFSWEEYTGGESMDEFYDHEPD